MVGNLIVKCELFLTSIFKFLRPPKNMNLIRGGHFEFQLNLEKLPAYLHIVGSVIVKYE